MTVVDINDVRRRRERAASFTALKLATLDQALVDSRLTDQDFRVFYYLASAADRETQVAKRKQRVIADALGITRRAVQISAERLSEFLYIEIQTKDGGSYTNGYRIIIEKANLDSPSENTKANPDSPFAQKRRTRAAKKANDTVEKGEPPFAPTLPFNSLEIPSRRRGPSSTDVLGPAGAELRRKLGAELYASWFGKARIESETEETITLSVPSRFIASRIKQEFDVQMLSAWQTISPTVRRIEVVVKPARS